MTETRKWTAATAVIVVATLALGWFLLVSPKRSDAASLRTQATAQEDTNQRLRTKVQQLKADAKDLPAQKARLAQIDVNLPGNPQLPALVRSLSQASRQSTVDLVSIAPAAPVVLTKAPAARVVPKTDGEAGTSGKSGTTSTSGTAAAPAATPVPAVQLAYIPVVVVADGDYFEAEQFLNKIEGFKRSFLVTGLTLEEPRSGAEKAPSGSVRMTVTGRVFLTVAGTPTTPTTPTAPAAAAAAK
jgi:type IV pilus assembly protein PilO